MITVKGFKWGFSDVLLKNISNFQIAPEAIGFFKDSIDCALLPRLF